MFIHVHISILIGRTTIKQTRTPQVKAYGLCKIAQLEDCFIIRLQIGKVDFSETVSFQIIVLLSSGTINSDGGLRSTSHYIRILQTAALCTVRRYILLYHIPSREAAWIHTFWPGRDSPASNQLSLTYLLPNRESR